MNKIVRIGRGNYGNVYAHIKFDDKRRLYITGVEGPTRDGNCKGSCGQIIMSPSWSINEYAPGWNKEIEDQFRTIWNRWHLNDMRAGSPKQCEFLRNSPDIPRDYDTVSAGLTLAGINPDYLHNGIPYVYGKAWLTESVPDEVITWLAALPDTDLKPAWI